MSHSFYKKYDVDQKEKGFRGYKIAKYGSTVNGLGNMQSSDLDLTIIVDDLQLCHEDILRNLKAIINKYGGDTSVKNYKNP